MNKTSNILWGLVLIVIGLIFGLNALAITDINIFFDGWWTLFIIVPSFIDLFKEKNKTGSIIGLIIGIALLLGCNNVLDFDLIWKLMFPTILVFIGLSLIFKDTLNGKIKKEIKKIKNDNIENEYYATFSSQNLDFNNEEFNGCNLNAIFGEIKCDLKNAKIKQDIVINAFAIFGEINLFLPEDVNIKLVSTPIFGAVSDKRNKKEQTKEITIYINATCMFGGIELK